MYNEKSEVETIKNYQDKNVALNRKCNEEPEFSIVSGVETEFGIEKTLEKSGRPKLRWKDT